MFNAIRPALVLLAGFTLLTGLAYPFAITAIAGAVWPYQAHGSLIVDNGRVVGSALIGQAFTSERYFQPRPSATTAADPAHPDATIPAPYNAAASGGSNLGPNAAALAMRVSTDAAQRRAENPDAPIPVDLVTASASGLDPDLSPAAALFQVPHIARARGLPEPALRALVQSLVQPRLIGVFGEPVVNVMALNRALDRLTPP